MTFQLTFANIAEYLKADKIAHKNTGKMVMIHCPYCQAAGATANLIPNTNTFCCLNCQEKYSVLEMVSAIHSEINTEDSAIAYIRDTLKLDIVTEAEVNVALQFYAENKFDLVRVAAAQKIPIEKEWTKIEHKNPEEWKDWLNNRLNIGIKTGIMSGVTVIDIDQATYPKEIFEDTLMQKSSKGFHFFYQYEADIPTTRVDEFNIDILNNGKQVVAYPSVVNGVVRKITYKPIAKMPDAMKKWLQSKITVPLKTASEKIREAIKTEDFKINPEELQMINEDLKGCCNSSFIKLGGILRKELNTAQTSFVLHTFNRHLLTKPMPTQAVEAMVHSLDKYIEFDEQELANKIITHLKNTDGIGKNEIESYVFGSRAVGENKLRLDKTLYYLTKEGLIIKKGREFQLIKKMEWVDTIADMGTPVNFEVPYFGSSAHFNWGDTLLIGGHTKVGKSTLAANIVSRLVKQSIKPYYVYNEPGGRFGKMSTSLGLKDGDIWRVFASDPEKVIFEKHAITIYDWVMPKDFAGTDKLFNSFAEKLDKTQGFLICFVQLKEDFTFFAKNLISQYPALISRYLYIDPNDGSKTKFVIDYAREAKSRNKKGEIPCVYDFDTKEVKMLEELEEYNDSTENKK
jgi:hypothetical protein